MRPAELAKLDQQVVETRVVRRVVTAADPFAKVQSEAAARMAEHLRKVADDDETAAEWGRGLLIASSYLGGLYVTVRDATNNGRDLSGLVLNVAAWCGVDLLPPEISSDPS